MNSIRTSSRSALGLAGWVALTACIGLGPFARLLYADTEDAFTIDVAIDCRTWQFNRGASFADAVRGDGFIANGKIFRGGTLATGTTGDPDAPGSIGTFIEYGTMAATVAEIAGGKRPAFAATWLHLFNDGRGLVAVGPHPDSGPMAVVGGMGDLSGASGQVAVVIIGTNSTGCPNVRSTITLKKQSPK